MFTITEFAFYNQQPPRESALGGCLRCAQHGRFDDISLIRKYLQAGVMERGVIGIRDRDYSDFVIGTNEVFAYDNSCMEMMFLEDEVALDKICCEFYHGDMNNRELKEHILSELCFLSCLRKLNEKKSWELILKGISISNACDKVTFKLCVENLKAQIAKVNSSKFDSGKCSEVDLEVTAHNTIEDFLLITQGHDFSSLFATICISLDPKSREYKEKTLKNVCGVLLHTFHLRIQNYIECWKIIKKQSV